MDNLKQTIARTFLELADAMETGNFGKKPRIAVTGIGSEHGESAVLSGAAAAARRGIEVIYLGTLTAPGVNTVRAETEDDCRAQMEKMLDSGETDGAVTMHYPFPIGVATVGRVPTPALGREMFIAATTGTSAADRVEAMVKNAIYGLIAAKACGVPEPAVGILNLDGARQTETALRELSANGYPIKLAESARSDGGAVMRGNDVLLGTPDILVCDSLTGNVLQKMLSAFNSGGSVESVGSGYGPGIGTNNSNRLVLIVSRASGSAVVEGAIGYAAQLVRGGWAEIAKAEFSAANKAGLSSIIESRKSKQSKAAPSTGPADIPPPEPVPASISGIDVMDIEEAVSVLHKNGIYAESGMGCTGPLVMISEKNLEKSRGLLQQAGYIG